MHVTTQYLVKCVSIMCVPSVYISQMVFFSASFQSLKCLITTVHTVR